MKSRHMTRFTVGVGVAALTAVTALAGCSSGGSSTTDGDVTLSYAIWDENQRPAIQEIADAFEAANEGVTIDIQVTPNKEYWTKLQTALSGGSGPDVFWMNAPRLPLYASEGQLAPMGDIVDTSLYPESLVELYTYDGQLWGAPKDFDTVALWYNAALFDAAGVEYPTEDWTWADVEAAAAAITDTANGVYGIVAPPYTQENVYPAVANAGGEIINADEDQSGYDSPEAQEAIEYWLGFIERGESPTGAQMVDTLAEDYFGAGKAGMMYAASYMALPFSQSAAAETINVAPLPSGPDNNDSVVHGLANVVNANSEHVEIAQQFAAFASGEQAAEIQAETGTVIPSVNGTQDAWVQAYPNYDAQVFIDAVETSVPYPVSLNRGEWGEIEAEVLPQIWAGTVSVQDGLSDLATRMQAVLDGEGD